MSFASVPEPTSSATCFHAMAAPCCSLSWQTARSRSSFESGSVGAPPNDGATRALLAPFLRLVALVADGLWGQLPEGVV